MYSVTVRDHFMIAHSLQGGVFGPAQRLHGATHVMDLERIAQGALGGNALELTHVKLTLHESQVAWAACEAALPLPRTPLQA